MSFCGHAPHTGKRLTRDPRLVFKSACFTLLKVASQDGVFGFKFSKVGFHGGLVGLALLLFESKVCHLAHAFLS
jgi:hypothetical protein